MILTHLEGLKDVSVGTVLIGAFPVVHVGASRAAWKMLNRNRLLPACVITVLPIVFALLLVARY